MNKHINSPYWAVIVYDNTLEFRCSDGRRGSEPFDSRGLDRLMNLIGENEYEVIHENTWVLGFSKMLKFSKTLFRE